MRTVRIGTRGSALARWQANWVAEQLSARQVAVELVYLKTQGDVRTESLGAIGGMGLFTKELQRALLDGTIDLAVHSLKDLPTEPVAGLQLAAIPPRENSSDVLVSNNYHCLAALPPGACVGTGSPRRRAQLLHQRPDLICEDIRGNVDTRLRKLDEGRYDALVLAEAGLRRLGWRARIAEVLSRDRMLPAVGQGALGLEIRENDQALHAELASLNDPATYAAVVAERTLLLILRAGCLAPVGAWARMDGERLVLDAVVLSLDGRERVSVRVEGHPRSPADLGRSAAEKLVEQGASDLMARAREGQQS